MMWLAIGFSVLALLISADTISTIRLGNEARRFNENRDWRTLAEEMWEHVERFDRPEDYASFERRLQQLHGEQPKHETYTFVGGRTFHLTETGTWRPVPTELRSVSVGFPLTSWDRGDDE
jgi:hypothetical protein